MGEAKRKRLRTTTDLNERYPTAEAIAKAWQENEYSRALSSVVKQYVAISAKDLNGTTSFLFVGV